MHLRISWLLWQNVLPQATPFLDLSRVDLKPFLEAFPRSAQSGLSLNPAPNVLQLYSRPLSCAERSSLYNHVHHNFLQLLGKVSSATPHLTRPGPLFAFSFLPSLFLAFLPAPQLPFTHLTFSWP